MKYFDDYMLLIVIIWFLVGCKTAQKSTTTIPRSIDHYLQDSILAKHHLGFALYDPSTDNYLHSRQLDKYFTPASNTKIFTLYTALNVLEERLATLDYYQKMDTIWIKGLGNPTFLNAELPKSDTEEAFFRANQGKTFIYLSNHFQDKKYGAGWSWDDGLYAYQLEKTPLPIYGNLVNVLGEPGTKNIAMSPNYFSDYIYIDIDTTYKNGWVKRDPDNNIFKYNYQLFDTLYNEISIPISFEGNVLLNLLMDTFDITIKALDQPVSTDRWSRLFSETPIDSTYRLFMQASDNFIGEQLLLHSSMVLFDTMNTSKIIQYAKDSLFNGFTDSLIWVDGSGLSRYNMFTPRSIVEVLQKIYDMKGLPWIQEIFPAGGYSGTIESWYGSDKEKPWIWAKTGTLRHNHCLSGYVQCASGKLLIFSMMNNHFTSSSSDIKPSMENLLRFIRDHY